MTRILGVILAASVFSVGLATAAHAIQDAGSDKKGSEDPNVEQGIEDPDMKTKKGIEDPGIKTKKGILDPGSKTKKGLGGPDTKPSP